MGFWKRIIVNALVFVALAYFMAPNFYVANVWVALGASLLLSLLNIFIKPILSLLSLPLTILTFGLFSFVIHAVMLLLTAALMGAGFYFASFGYAFLVALIMAVVTTIVSND